MKKIIHLITGLYTGGAEVMLYKLMQNMNKSEYENIVVSMIDMGTMGERIESCGVKVYTLNMRRGVPNLSGIKNFLNILKKEKPDILQTWLYHADLMGLLCGKIAGIKKICWNIRCSHIDMDKYPLLSGIVIKVLARLSRYPDAVLINSISGKNLHEKIGYKNAKWVYIPNGFELEKFVPSDAKGKKDFRTLFGLPEDAFIIGMVARFDPMKDHENLIKSGEILYKLYKADNVYFFLVGKGLNEENENLTAMLDKYNVRSRFFLLGERNDSPYLISNFDVACLSSYGEGFSNTIGEAMSCKVPCVVTDVGDSRLIVGDSGIVVPPKNSEAFAEALHNILIMKDDERKQLGSRAREIIETNYSIDVITSKYESLYKNLFK